MATGSRTSAVLCASAVFLLPLLLHRGDAEDRRVTQRITVLYDEPCAFPLSKLSSFL